MTRPAPVGGIPPLQVERTRNRAAEHDRRREIRGQRRDRFEQAVGDLILDLVPVLRALGQLVGQEADQLEGVLARRCARGIDYRRRQRQDDRIVQIEAAGAKGREHARQRRERFETAHGDARHRAGFRLESRRLTQCVVRREHRDARLPAGDARGVVRPEVRVAHDIGEVADVDRGHDRLCRGVGRPVRGDDAGRAPSLDHNSGDRPGGQDGAAVLFDDPRQRQRQADRPAFGQDPAEALAAGDQGEGERAGFGLVEWMQRHECDPAEEGPDVLLLEPRGDHVEGAGVTNRDAAVAQRTGLRPGQHLGRPTWRVLALVVDDRRQALPIIEQRPVCLRIRLREARQLATGAIEVTPHRDAAAVAKGHGEHGIRVQITQAIAIELQLVVAHQGVALDQVVRRGTRIVDEAGQGQLLGRGVTTDPVRALEHQHLEAGPRRIGGRQQAVVTGAGHHDVPLAHAVAPR